MNRSAFVPFPQGEDLAVTRGLAAQLTHLAHLVSADGEVGSDQVKSAVVDLVIDMLPGVSWASMTELRPPLLEPVTSASSDAVATWLDDQQYLAGQGPCLEALNTAEVVTTANLRADDRWRGFVTLIPEEHPVQAVRSYPLSVTGGVFASLNLYSERTASFQDENVQAANVVAAVTSLVVGAMKARQHRDQVTAALAEDRHLATAMGVLMGRHSWTQVEAFTALRSHLKGHSDNARDVAAHVIATGELPA